jgi:ribonuclease P/MRP protein subunit RPP20
LERARKVLNANSKENFELVIHGLGAAMNMAIDVALELQKTYHQFYVMHVQTHTVKLVDDFIPIDNDNQEVLTQVRYNSAVRITFKHIPQATSVNTMR